MHKIIPHPASITPEKGTFTLNDATTIRVQAGMEEVRRIGQMLADLLRPATGYPFPVLDSGDKESRGSISLAIAATDAALGEEGYDLRVRPDRIILTASNPAGLFHGIQTIRQLLPPAIEKRAPQRWPMDDRSDDHPRPSPFRLARFHARRGPPLSSVLP